MRQTILRDAFEFAGYNPLSVNNHMVDCDFGNRCPCRQCGDLGVIETDVKGFKKYLVDKSFLLKAGPKRLSELLAAWHRFKTAGEIPCECTEE